MLEAYVSSIHRAVAIAIGGQQTDKLSEAIATALSEMGMRGPYPSGIAGRIGKAERDKLIDEAAAINKAKVIAARHRPDVLGAWELTRALEHFEAKLKEKAGPPSKAGRPDETPVIEEYKAVARKLIKDFGSVGQDEWPVARVTALLMYGNTENAVNIERRGDNRPAEVPFDPEVEFEAEDFGGKPSIIVRT